MVVETSIIENQIIYWWVGIIFFCGIVFNFIRILAPNWNLKRIINGKSKRQCYKIRRGNIPNHIIVCNGLVCWLY